MSSSWATIGERGWGWGGVLEGGVGVEDEVVMCVSCSGLALVSTSRQRGGRARAHSGGSLVA